jgi:hypothetical protein
MSEAVADSATSRSAHPFAAPLRETRAEIAAIVCLVPLLLAVALWNRFPIIFYDTGAYVFEGLGGNFLVERSPVYSLFLRVAGGGLSLWCIVVVQALATAFAMVECARALAPRLSLGAFLALGTALVVATGLPWYAGEIEPDCFAAIAVLSLYVLTFHGGRLDRWRRGLLFGTAVLAVAVHLSHLMLATGLVAVLALYAAARRLAKADGPQPHLTSPALVCVSGLVVILACNFLYTGQVFVSRAGPAFLFGRLLQDRIVMRLLDDTCPQSHYRLCAYKNVLPPSADGWMWGRDSPFQTLGRYAGTADESQRIIGEALRRYPLLNMEMALGDTARQFVTFKTGDQVEPQEWALRPSLQAYIPTQVAAYMSARQQRGEFRFGTINRLHVAVGFLSLAGMALAIGVAIWRRRRETIVFLGFILVALIGNAFICGVLATPHDRYQSRLIWLVPFALALVLVERPSFALRGSRESVT